MKKFYFPSVLAIVLIMFTLANTPALASSTGTHANTQASVLIYCSGVSCNKYKAVQTHCTDNFHMLQDTPVYAGSTQVGTFRFWRSDACNTFWSQIYALNCTSVDNLQSTVYVNDDAEPTVDNFGLEGGCSLSSTMLYEDPGAVLVSGNGAIHFTDGRSWIYAPGSGKFPS
ncbi:hypothetical protein EPA93_37220 [Ktedonosporobacter rubrisoli]|uniref:DUF2690 domain-containing protein n=1 Tax=Ktedonosporobacter rubrisoli TaxID=2509675 RepID=A0A4P6K1H4_KTERU|nr:hypothetical protein [Ktedonosporobacter rubrisoli]QBD81316.1 hypothetical protein EPA93_37220 [Ktedonosporobacter rubrisoli]